MALSTRSRLLLTRSLSGRSMKKCSIIYLLISVCIIFPSSVIAETFPDFPMAFYGQATLNGDPMATGNTIRAYYGTDLGGEIKVQSSGIYGYPELNGQRLVVKEGNGPITFKFVDLSGNEKGGNSFMSYTAFSSGDTIEKDLNFVTTVAAVVQSYGGGGGGGGGGTVTQTSTLNTAAQKVDTNKDGKVDVLEFVSLMANWGKTEQSNVADFNSDGKVDILDFVSLMANWTK